MEKAILVKDTAMTTDIPAAETVINRRNKLKSEPASEYGAGFFMQKNAYKNRK